MTTTSPYTDIRSSLESLTPLEGLRRVIKALRDKDHGCPWDIAQDFQDLAALTLEEAYEVVQTLEEQDYDALKEELGDLLFHIVFYAQIAEERELFNFDEIADKVKEKMLRRHPHVFERKDLKDLSTRDMWESHLWQAHLWETQKKKEKPQGLPQDVLLSPSVFPSLLLASRLGKASAREDFDWESPKAALEKVREEISELEDVLDTDREKAEEEWGDMVFACAQVARKMGFSPEYALRKACQKFASRYHTMTAQTGYERTLPLEDKNAFWQKAKKETALLQSPMAFMKMNGLGNDFIVVDFRYKEHDVTSEHIRILSDRRFGIGCDQFVIITNPSHQKADAKMIFYNSDGKPASACGNATRCVAMFIMDEKASHTCILQVGETLLDVVRDKEGLLTVSMGKPLFSHPSLPKDPTPLLSLVPGALNVHVVNVGNPHVAFLVSPDTIETLPLSTFGPTLSHHPLFPDRCNVELIAPLNETRLVEKRLRVRVWERGAGITLACGTGACAAAVAYATWQNTLPLNTEVIMDGGSLFITYDGSIHMKGPATLNFHGSVSLP